MEFKPGLQRTVAFDVEATRREAEQAGFTTFALPREIADRASFFDAVRATFPLDPPLIGSDVWDALSDSLWEGPHDARRIAILWPGTRAMAASARSDFEIALDVLAQVASLLADPQATIGNTKEVAILVDVGENSMRYIKVLWKHQRSDDPVILYSELDENGYEVRKVEEYRHGHLDYADNLHETGSTWLAEFAIPSVEEIAKDDVFEPAEISREQFEIVWRTAVDMHRPATVKKP